MPEYEVDTPPDCPNPLDDGAESADQTAADSDVGLDRGPDSGAELRATLTSLAEGMAAFHDRAASRERVIDRLAGENDSLRAGERALVLRPIAVDLQRLRNDLLRQAANLPADMTPAATALLLESFAFSVEQTLERCGVNIIRPEVGERFDPARHRASATEAAPSAELDGAIASVLADGYLDATAGRAMTAATVRVFRWLPVQPDPHAVEDRPDPAVPFIDPTALQTIDGSR